MLLQQEEALALESEGPGFNLGVLGAIYLYVYFLTCEGSAWPPEQNTINTIDLVL